MDIVVLVTKMVCFYSLTFTGIPISTAQEMNKDPESLKSNLVFLIHVEAEIAKYNNINLKQNVKFDPLDRTGTKTFCRKSQETNKNLFRPKSSYHNSTNKSYQSYGNTTHFPLGSSKETGNSENRDNYGRTREGDYTESKKNHNWNTKIAKQQRDQHFTLKTSKGKVYKGNFSR